MMLSLYNRNLNNYIKAKINMENAIKIYNSLEEEDIGMIGLLFFNKAVLEDDLRDYYNSIISIKKAIGYFETDPQRNIQS